MSLLPTVVTVEPYHHTEGLGSILALAINLFLFGGLLLALAVALVLEPKLRFIAALPALLGLASLGGGAFTVVQFTQANAEETSRFRAWVDDSYGIELESGDVNQLQIGGVVYLEDGNDIYLVQQKDGGVLLSHHVQK